MAKGNRPVAASNEISVQYRSWPLWLLEYGAPADYVCGQPSIIGPFYMHCAKALAELSVNAAVIQFREQIGERFCMIETGEGWRTDRKQAKALLKNVLGCLKVGAKLAGLKFKVFKVHLKAIEKDTMVEIDAAYQPQ